MIFIFDVLQGYIRCLSLSRDDIHQFLTSCLTIFQCVQAISNTMETMRHDIKRVYREFSLPAHVSNPIEELSSRVDISHCFFRCRLLRHAGLVCTFMPGVDIRVHNLDIVWDARFIIAVRAGEYAQNACIQHLADIDPGFIFGECVDAI